VVTSGFSGITEFGYLLSHFVGLVSGDEHRLVIYDFVAGCMCLGYGDGFAAKRNEGRFLLAHYVTQRCASHEFDREHVKCVVHRIPNDDRIADSARAAIVLSQGHLPLKCAAGAIVGYSSKAGKTDHFIPTR
jgi:hypothetical protein